MPKPRDDLATAVVNGKIYAIGGREQLRPMFATVEEYDPVTDKWTKKADMPTARARLSACVVDGKIYAIGGLDDAGAAVSTVEVYDPVTDKWTKKDDMLTAREFLSTSVANGKIYVIGGSDGAKTLSTVEEYTPEKASISPASPQSKLTTTWGKVKKGV